MILSKVKKKMFCKEYVTNRAKIAKTTHNLSIPLTKLIDALLYLADWKCAIDFNKKESNINFNIKHDNLIVNKITSKESGVITKEYIYAVSFVINKLINPESTLYDKGILDIMRCTYPFLVYSEYHVNRDYVDLLVYAKIYNQLKEKRAKKEEYVSAKN